MGVNRHHETRAWYPSGPRIDAAGNRIKTEYVYRDAPAEKLPNPDPANYEIQEAIQVGAFLVIKIKYPDCNNFEGQKILVYKDKTALDLLKQKFIDPHFFENKKVASPVARFVPTKEGWEMAIRFAMSETEFGKK
jgi:hypothetical protein